MNKSGLLIRVILKAHMVLVGLVCVNAIPAHAQSVELKQAVDSAFAYTDVQRFEDALSVLSQVGEEDKEHYLYGLTRARILTWSRKYSEAQSEFDELVERYPDNPDILVPYAYLQLFDGNLDKSEQIFNRVLLQYPNYQDAYVGLGRVKELKKEKRSIFSAGYQVIENLTD